MAAACCGGGGVCVSLSRVTRECDSVCVCVAGGPSAPPPSPSTCSTTTCSAAQRSPPPALGCPSLASDSFSCTGRAHHLSHPRLQRRRHQRPQQHLRRSATPPPLHRSCLLTRAIFAEKEILLMPCCCFDILKVRSPALLRRRARFRVKSVAGGEPARRGAWPRHDRPGGSGLAVLVDGRLRAARAAVLPPCSLLNHRDSCCVCH